MESADIWQVSNTNDSSFLPQHWECCNVKKCLNLSQDEGSIALYLSQIASNNTQTAPFWIKEHKSEQRGVWEMFLFDFFFPSKTPLGRGWNCFLRKRKDLNTAGKGWWGWGEEGKTRPEEPARHYFLTPLKLCHNFGGTRDAMSPKKVERVCVGLGAGTLAWPVHPQERRRHTRPN